MPDVVVLVEDMYEELELWYPYHRMREAGFDVALVGPEPRVYSGRFGYPAEANSTPADINVLDLKALVIPGGYSPDRMRRSEAMVALVRDAYQAGAQVAAICHGGWMLAEADVVRGHQLTCFSSISRDVVNAGGTYVDEPVVVDGNLITSRTPDDLPWFCAALVKAAKGD